MNFSDNCDCHFYFADSEKHEPSGAKEIRESLPEDIYRQHATLEHEYWFGEDQEQHDVPLVENELSELADEDANLQEESKLDLDALGLDFQSEDSAEEPETLQASSTQIRSDVTPEIPEKSFQ